MKWTGMYLLGYIVLIGGVLAALWKMGVLASIGATWRGPGGVGPSQLGEPTHKTPVDRVFFELRTVNWPSKWPS